MKIPPILLAGLLLVCCQVAEPFVPQYHVTISPYQRVQAGLPSIVPRVEPLKGAKLTYRDANLRKLRQNRKASGFQKQVQSALPLWSLISQVSIPLSAVLGYRILPRFRTSIRVASALVSSVAAAVGKSYLDVHLEGAATPAVAHALIRRGLEDPAATLRRVKRVQRQSGIRNEDQFQIVCAHVATRYILGMLQDNASATINDMKEVRALRESLGLTNFALGQALHSVAVQIGKETRYNKAWWSGRTTYSGIVSKFLFIAERALHQANETEVATKFEMNRIMETIGLPPSRQDLFKDQGKVVLYLQALGAARKNLGTNKVTLAMLHKARDALGISEYYDIHCKRDCLRSEVLDLLGIPESESALSDGGPGSGSAEAEYNNQHATMEDSGNSTKDESGTRKEIDYKPHQLESRFPPGAMERLTLLRRMLNVDENATQMVLASEVEPLLRARLDVTLRDLLHNNTTLDEAWERVNTHIQELLVPDFLFPLVLIPTSRARIQNILLNAAQVANRGDEAATHDCLVEAVERKNIVMAFLRNYSWATDEKLQEELFGGENAIHSCLAKSVCSGMYKTFLSRIARCSIENKISDTTFELISNVSQMLGIPQEGAKAEIDRAFTPELAEICEIACHEILNDYTPVLATKLQKRIEQYLADSKVTESSLQKAGRMSYEKALAEASKRSPSGIPTSTMNEALDSLRKMYHLDEDLIHKLHKKTFGPVYKQCVLEAMGSTGIIQPEIKEALANLRTRLGVTDKITKDLYLEAMADRFKSLVSWINSEVERKSLNQKQLSRKRRKDQGQDVFVAGGGDNVLGIGAEVNIMSDILNLLTFYEENEIAVEEQVGNETRNGIQVPKYETKFPLTATGTAGLDKSVANYLYRQYLVGIFTGKEDQVAYLEKNRHNFGRILGLLMKDMDKERDEIADAVYDNFVAKTLGSKGSIDHQDMMSLANIQKKLGLTSDEGAKLLKSKQVKFLLKEFDSVIENRLPESLRAFREKCNSLGIDLVTDLKLSKGRVLELFEHEVSEALKSGEVTVSDSDTLSEIQESLGLSERDCEDAILKLLVRLAKDSMKVITTDLLRGRSESALNSIKDLVRYAAFVDGDLQLRVSTATAQEIYGLYESQDFTGEDEAQVATNKELLQEALGIERDPSATPLWPLGATPQ